MGGRPRGIAGGRGEGGREGGRWLEKGWGKSVLGEKRGEVE